MEATAVSVGKSALDGALSYATSVIAEEVALQLGIQRDQAFIRDELQMMQSFLMAADKDQGDHEVLKTWVKQVRDVAYDVEDCLQDYVVRLKKTSWWRFPCTKLREGHRIANEMKELRAKVEDVSHRNMRYNLIHGPAATGGSKPTTVSAAEQFDIAFHIEATRRAAKQEKLDLFRLMTEEGNDLRVMVVWGGGDVGMASIVRAAYQAASQKMKGEIEIRAWVRLTRPLNSKEFTGNLVRQFHENSSEEDGKTHDEHGKTQEDIQATGVSVFKKMDTPGYSSVDDFNDFVTKKRYFVVLNGLSTIEEWDWIKTYFPNKHNGSRIILCTEHAEVARCFIDGQHKVSEIQQEAGSFGNPPIFVLYKKLESSLMLPAGELQSGSRDSNIPDGCKDAEAPRNMKDARTEATELLSIDSQPGQAISFWGMAAVGRSTIVRCVYANVVNTFDRSAWFSISRERPLSTKTFMEDVLMQLSKDGDIFEDGSEHADNTSDDKLSESFRNMLSRNKCLVVIDNISSRGEWKSIRKELRAASPTSRIIVATRKFGVALHCSGAKEYTYRLEASNATVDEIAEEDGYSTHPSSGNSSPQTQYRWSPPDRDIEEQYYSSGSGSGSGSPQSGSGSPEISSIPVTLIRNVTGLFGEGAHLIGREKEMRELLVLLSKPGQERTVISVWGMGGIGKTTLAGSIYQSPELENHGFKRRAWVTVMRPFRSIDLLRILTQRLIEDSLRKKEAGGPPQPGSTKNNTSLMDIADLHEKLVEVLHDHKYLIVLDDLSSRAEWDSIVMHLPENGKGGRIIVTTRHEIVARHCSNRNESNMHNIEGLTVPDALELFKKKVYKEIDAKLKPGMEKEAKIIIKKCGCLPLAIDTVGGYLSTRPRNIEEWRKFRDHISVELANNPELDTIKTVLNSSYDGLPYHLKSCFLYLSIFPEDHNIRRGRLTRRWIAEGYSKEMKVKTAEEVADEYFMDIINRNMTKPSKIGIHQTRKTIGFCKVHDLMREISISKSEEEHLVFVLDDHTTSSSKDKVRHLVVSLSWSREKKMNELESIVDLSHIRSLTVFGEWRPFFISKKMRMLRVLDLEDADGLQDHDLVPIGKLLHLKYLCLRGCNRIVHLPESLGDLLNLETLDIRGTFITKLPRTIGKLKKLKYLRAGMPPDDEDDTRSVSFRSVIYSICSGYYANREDLKISVAISFILLFINGWLRNLDLCGVEVPKGICRSRAMHTLGVVNIARANAFLKNLRKLTQLRKLGITGINKDNCKELCSAIAELGHLESLLLRAEGKAGIQGCLDNTLHGSFSPPKGLKSLKLYGNLVELPKWIGKQLGNLKKLCLRSTNLENGAAIKALRSLPVLDILRLLDKAFEKGTLYFSRKGFKRLTRLELVSWNSLTSVEFAERAMPKLEVISVDHCENIDQDGFYGIELLSSLKEVSLDGYYYSELKDELCLQLEENHNKPCLKIV